MGYLVGANSQNVSTSRISHFAPMIGCQSFRTSRRLAVQAFRPTEQLV